MLNLRGGQLVLGLAVRVDLAPAAPRLTNPDMAHSFGFNSEAFSSSP